ncbi:MAG: single-stranded DNA-binding protein [Bacteroidetes bacterium]|nr:single-stranded DNA-binding protein [Bacteroidota bacterium]
MTNVNHVQLTGNLGSTPELKTFENGNKLLKFSLATNEEYKTQRGESATDTQWHNISVWGKLAENLESQLKKGSFVSVEGRISTRSYNDKSGTKKYFVEIVANNVLLKTNS